MFREQWSSRAGEVPPQDSAQGELGFSYCLTERTAVKFGPSRKEKIIGAMEQQIEHCRRPYKACTVDLRIRQRQIGQRPDGFAHRLRDVRTGPPTSAAPPLFRVRAAQQCYDESAASSGRARIWISEWSDRGSDFLGVAWDSATPVGARVENSAIDGQSANPFIVPP
jgi:hypothetical protein